MTDVFKNIADVAADLITQAYTIRKEFVNDISSHNDIVFLYEELRKTRNGLDRLEVLLSDSMRLKALAETQKNKATWDVEDAEIRVSEQKVPKADYQSARDAGVTLNAKTLTERKVLRKATEAFTEAQTAVDIIRNFHRGLDSRRRDIDLAMKATTFVSAYEK